MHIFDHKCPQSTKLRTLLNYTLHLTDIITISTQVIWITTLCITVVIQTVSVVYFLGTLSPIQSHPFSETISEQTLLIETYFGLSYISGNCFGQAYKTTTYTPSVPRSKYRPIRWLISIDLMTFPMSSFSITSLFTWY